MAKAEKKVMSKGRKIFLTIVCIFVGLLLVGLRAGVIIYNSMMNKLNRVNPDDVVINNDAGISVPTEDPSGPTVDPYAFDVMFPGEEPIGGDIINIMLVGQDTRDPERRGLSDTMILISINPKNGKLVMTSFMRDLYIDIVGISGTGLYKERLNTAYCTGGINQLGNTLAYNFGVEIDNFIEVDFAAFQTVVDAIGGVDIELTAREAEHMYYESDKQWDLKEGMNHLDGEQALFYARIRKIDSDFYRTERQRNVITAMISKVKSASLVELMNLAEEFLPMVTTDMSNKDITKYIIQLVPMLKNLEINSLRIPIDGTWGGKDVGTEEQPKYVIGCHDTKANRDALREAVGITETE